jgi:hypothetical protein
MLGPAFRADAFTREDQMRRANFPGRKTLRRLRAGHGTDSEIAEAARHLTRTKGGKDKSKPAPRERHDFLAEEFRGLVK